MDFVFFYVTHHRISDDLMDKVFAGSEKLFNFPLQDQMGFLRNEKQRGYTPVLDELLDPPNQIHCDHKEGFVLISSLLKMTLKFKKHSEGQIYGLDQGLKNYEAHCPIA
ncbi:hypothetical protein LXL04_000046 [Taraxacum kok-saghyz]